jgi:hypothetical protein
MAFCDLIDKPCWLASSSQTSSLGVGVQDGERNGKQTERYPEQPRARNRLQIRLRTTEKHEISRAGAGQSQVHILSPRLEERAANQHDLSIRRGDEADVPRGTTLGRSTRTLARALWRGRLGAPKLRHTWATHLVEDLSSATTGLRACRPGAPEARSDGYRRHESARAVAQFGRARDRATSRDVAHPGYCDVANPVVSVAPSPIAKAIARAIRALRASRRSARSRRECGARRRGVWDRPVAGGVAGRSSQARLEPTRSGAPTRVLTGAACG